MFPFTIETFKNLELAIFLNLLLYTIFLLAIPSLLIITISFFKPKIKEKSSFYLYAFSCATFIMLGTLGLIKEGFENGSEFVETIFSNTTYQQLLLALIVVGGAIIGLTFTILFRFFFIKRSGEVHTAHEIHSHDDHIFNLKDIDNPKAAWLVIFLILSHRTIDGFVLGASVARISNGDVFNLGLIITFNIHIFVEVLIIYYRQIQYGQTKWKAVFYNFLTLLAVVPIMFVGAYINQYLQLVGWFLPLTNVAGGSIITFVGVIELVPEFLHYKKMNAIEWYKLIICFSLGIIFSVLILVFDNHTHSESETNISNQLDYGFIMLKNNYLVFKI